MKQHYTKNLIVIITSSSSSSISSICCNAYCLWTIWVVNIGLLKYLVHNCLLCNAVCALQCVELFCWHCWHAFVSVCDRSCRWAPLVPCDYCPLYFHMDCLDPPLCSLPSGRWMCPNHVEHGVVSLSHAFACCYSEACFDGQLTTWNPIDKFELCDFGTSFPIVCSAAFQDEKLLNSVCVTERVKLYDKFCSRPVNQHAIKIQFLNKIHRQHPPFRIKAKHPRTKTVKVCHARVLPDTWLCKYEQRPILFMSK